MGLPPTAPTGLIWAGVGLLCASLWPVGTLLRSLRPSPLRAAWTCLAGLVVLFIAGYVAVARLRAGGVPTAADWVVAAILLAGAGFVLAVAALSSRTVRDVGRIATLERDASVDPLTGLYNRRHLDARLHDEFLRAQRYRRPLSVLLIDLDHFKQVNDGHGHQAGDAILRAVALAVRNGVRPSDLAARYGGEELMVIAPETDGRSAAIVAERLRRTVAAVQVPAAPDGPPVSVTASVGLASLSSAATDAAALVAAADRALYRAKHEGRNCVRLAA